MPDDVDVAERQVREQAQKVEEALLAIMGAPPQLARDVDWVTVPLRLPLSLATLMMLLANKGEHDVSVLYANILLRGLWALGEDEPGLSEVSRAAALLIWRHAATADWDSWSERHTRAKEYVAQHQSERRRS